MIKITTRVVTEGKDLPEIIKEFESDSEKIKQDVIALGQSTLEYIHRTIDQRKRRPSGNQSKLKKAIDIEYFGDGNTVGWGIGDIARLKAEAPYWAMVNYGGVIPGSGKLVPLGGFMPGNPKPSPEDFGKGRWNVGGGKYTFRAKRPIVRPLAYIQLTNNWLNNRLDILSRIIK